MDERIRLVYIPELFKGSARTLLIYKPCTWPTIDNTIFVPLRDTFCSLGEQTTKAIALHRQPYTKALGGVEIYARCDGGKNLSGGQKGLTTIPSQGGPKLDWRCPPEIWSRFADLISGLIRFGDGHQYLTCGPEEDAQVMVSAGEYFDEDFGANTGELGGA